MLHGFDLAATSVGRRMGAEAKHLRTVDGMRVIVECAARMNPSGKRGYRPETILEALEMKA